jgi:hypothetical protein
MLNQYVNLSPQQRMAQMLQQQQTQQTQLQGDQPQMPQAQNPFGGAADAMRMYGKMNQAQSAQNMQDYIARTKASGGMADMAAAGGGGYTANNGT